MCMRIFVAFLVIAAVSHFKEPSDGTEVGKSASYNHLEHSDFDMNHYRADPRERKASPLAGKLLSKNAMESLPVSVKGSDDLDTIMEKYAKRQKRSQRFDDMF